MNGSSLPAPNELTIRTRGLIAIRFDKPGTVTAEAGIPLQDLRHVLQDRFGYDLPVTNGGSSTGGPSVGGFINAGGYGDGSAKYGGFWENVDAVTVIGPGGAWSTIERDDPRFPWLFGAMGQLGVIVEARLDLVPVDAAHPPPYPQGARATVDFPPSDPTRMAPIYWYTLFVSPAEKDAAAAALAEIQARHQGEMTFRPPFTDSIHHRRVTAPLIYPHDNDFFAVGIWGDGPEAATVEAIDREVAALAAKAGYRRYVQVEVLAGPHAYEAYFGDLIWRDLQQRRKAIDPESLINRNTVFPEL
jgi:FAD/FMN-containing dehydrogenase